ncbi:hypothetical protein HU200_053989 [Digitaria exilis]|uniref:Uncharacterized protein n=1 Tax=Digitaria exilis TaxID=1010633 RepID=A0A835ALL8_9POAL|nr:hypothetical protein HU200_053989 [Digitaria exilis]
MTIVTCKPASILSETLKEVSDIILELDGPRRHAAGAFTQLIFGVRIHPQPRTKSVRCATCGDGVARLLPGNCEVRGKHDALLRLLQPQLRPPMQRLTKV